jgi:hypothetical protein
MMATAASATIQVMLAYSARIPGGASGLQLFQAGVGDLPDDPDTPGGPEVQHHHGAAVAGQPQLRPARVAPETGGAWLGRRATLPYSPIT